MALQRITKKDLREGLKICSFDLETVTLDAEFGRLLCGTVKELGKAGKTFRIDKDPCKHKGEPWNDESLAVALRDELNKYHAAVAYNGLGFDVRFLNSRLLYHGYEPLSPGIQHVDPLPVVRAKMRLGQNSLARVLDFLKCDEQKMHLGPDVWQRAAAGSKKDMDLLVKRNQSDVVALEQLFNKLVSLMPLKFSLIR